MKTRQSLALASAILLVGSLVAVGVSAAATEMTIATFHPRTRTADVEGLFHFKEILEKSSNGGIKVNVFFGGTLGGERELTEQLKLGTVHLALEGWATRGAYARKIIPWGVPYLFSDKEQIQRTVSGRIGQELKAAYARRGSSGRTSTSGATASSRVTAP